MPVRGKKTIKNFNFDFLKLFDNFKPQFDKVPFSYNSKIYFITILKTIDYSL